MFESIANPSTRFFFSACFLFGICATAILTPLVIRLARKLGAVDADSSRDLSRSAIPTLGGLGIAIPVLLSCAGMAWLFLSGSQHPELFSRVWARFPLVLTSYVSRNLFLLSIGGLAVIILGLIDDLRGLKSREKFLGQFIIAVFICAGGATLRGVYIPLVGGVSLGPVAGFVISILWIVGLINAFNLIDGLDGLATGIGVIAAATLVVLGAIMGNPITVIVCTVLLGSLLAFLAFNFHPARIFLGDTGSMFIGYMLAAGTLMGSYTYKSETAIILLAPVLALSFPIYETLLSMARRYFRGMPIFVGDLRHTHHRLLEKGLSPRQVVLSLYAFTLLPAAAAIISQVIPKGNRWEWLPVGIVIVSLLGIARWAGYIRPDSIRLIFKRRRRNTVLRAFSQYAIRSLTVDSAAISPSEILELCRRELRLCFLEVWFEKGPILIGSSGLPGSFKGEESKSDSTERIRVKSISGHRIIIRYRYDHPRDEMERRDVTACLAGIFQTAGVNLLLKKAVSLQSEIADRALLEEIERNLTEKS
jgi:UDP-GlcNAc:undecaprenyl-phosphate/decaprenyl-phosphate GlcNAc-1-phosphate transferase